MRDAVIVGGGLAGLSAAWRMRHWDIEVLEASERVGGRIRSEKRGQHFLNWGGHVFSGAGSSTHQLFGETGTATIGVPGALTGLSMNGRFFPKGRVQTYPFRVPMSCPARWAVLRTGAKVSLDVLRYTRAVKPRPGEDRATRQVRIYGFENDRSFADYIGDLPEDAEALFRTTVTRSAGDPEEISAGAGIGYFSLVWNIGAGLSRSVLGGPSTLTETISSSLGARVNLGSTVQEISHQDDHLVVRYIRNGQSEEVRARTVVLATPAPISHDLGVTLPAGTREALAQIRYGSYVSAAFLTGERDPRPWDDTYGIATPKRSFSIALNMGNIVHGRSAQRQTGGSMMTFSAASAAQKLIDRSDEEITETYLGDLERSLPGFTADVEEAHVQRWPIGAPYCFPGRGKLQPALTKPTSRVFLAGDYLGSLYSETAVETGFSAAQQAVTTLLAERERTQPTDSPGV